MMYLIKKQRRMRRRIYKEIFSKVRVKEIYICDDCLKSVVKRYDVDQLKDPIVIKKAMVNISSDKKIITLVFSKGFDTPLQIKFSKTQLRKLIKELNKVV